MQIGVFTALWGNLSFEEALDNIVVPFIFDNITIISQLIDSTIFMFLAFYMAHPGWDVVFIIS